MQLYMKELVFLAFFPSQVLPTKLTDPIQLTNYFSEMKVFVTSRSHLAILLYVSPGFYRKQKPT